MFSFAEDLLLVLEVKKLFFLLRLVLEIDLLVPALDHCDGAPNASLVRAYFVLFFIDLANQLIDFDVLG